MDNEHGWLRHFGRGVGALAVRFALKVGFDPVSVGWYVKNDYPRIAEILGSGGPAWSGETVNVNSALNHSVVWACNKIISESIGFIPAVVKQVRNGDSEDGRALPIYNAMKMSPNEELTAQNFMETLTSHCVLGGNGYAQIIRRSSGGSALRLYPLTPDRVDVDREKAGAKRIVYVVKTQHEPNKTFTVVPEQPQDILHIRGLGWDGLRGYGVITMARQSIGSAIATERNVARFWAHGGRKPYYLKLLQKFKTDDDANDFRRDWEAIYDEPNKAPIVEPWFDYKEMGMSMRDAQMLQTREFTVAEICRWFSISPHMVGDLSRATFSNIEHLFLQFLQMTLATWINRWEQEFWRSILTNEEKEEGYELRFDVEELLRGDFKTRMEGYASALQNGHMTIDEVRARQRLNKVPKGAGSHHHIQVNLQRLDAPPAAAAAAGAQKFRTVTL